MGRVALNDATATLHSGVGVEAEPGVDLRRNVPRHDLDNLLAEVHSDTVHGTSELLLVRPRLRLTEGYCIFHKGLVLRHSGGFVDKRRVGRGILWAVPVGGSRSVN